MVLTHHEKKNIASRIEQLKNKKYYKQIFKIVHDESGKYTMNDNGVYLNINILPDTTLLKIRTFLDNLEKETPIIPVPEEYIPYSETDSSINMSTHEKSIIKRMKDNESDSNIAVWGTSEGQTEKLNLKLLLND